MTGNKMIRCLALLLTLAMLLPLLPALPVHAKIVESGKCGENVTYTLDSNGVLKISGVGKMNDWEHSIFPFTRSVKEVIIGDGVTSIGSSAFYGCESLTSVTIGNSVTSIGNTAFWDCRRLRSVTIPDSVTSIGTYAFSGCTSLKSVTIGNSVTSIGDAAFRGCTGLTSVTIGNSVTSIGNSAFWDCKGLTSVTIPDSVTSIGYRTFYNCTRLTSVMIPDSVTKIDEDAFSKCTGLKSVTIPNSVKSIGKNAFSDCTGLQEVFFVGKEEQWNAISFGSDVKAFLDPLVHFVGFVIDNFDFETDSYFFDNYTIRDKDNIIQPLHWKYFEAIYYPGQSGQLLDFYHKHKTLGAGGLCFGMAYTTASILCGLPAVDQINHREHLRKVQKSDSFDLAIKHINFEDESMITVDDFIKYAHVYQYNSSPQTGWHALFPENANDSFKDLYDKIVQYIDEGIFVSIILKYAKRDEHGNLTFQDIKHFESDGCHAVLAVGYEGRSILIDDPNYKDGKKQLCRLTFSDDYKDWHYDNPWRSSKPLDDDHAILIINTDCAEPYRILSTGKKVYHEKTDAGETAAIVSGTERIDGGKNLLLVDSPSFTLDRDDYYEVMPTYGEDDGDSNARLFWTDSDRTVTISGIEGDDNYFSFAGDHHTVSVDTAGTGDVTLTVDEENDDYTVEADATVNSEYEIAFSTLPDEDADRRVITVSGTASGESVRVAGTESGIEIEGFGSATVTLADQDGNVLDTTQIRADGKQKEIVVDSEKDSFAEDPSEPSTDPPTAGLRGDANLDGKVLANDARLVLRASAKLETLSGQAFVNCDLNGDGRLFAGEARKILRYSAKLESAL